MAERDWRPFVYGGLASCAAEFGTFPIDTTKTRLQIQGQIIDAKHVENKYRGMIDAFLQISRKEGFQALYAGIYPAVLRQATYGTIKFGTYYTLKRFASTPGEEDIVINVSCAVVSGIVSSSIANPTDVLKVRMQVLGVQTNSILGSFQDVYRHEGISGLWRGVGPTAQRAAVIAAVELPVYDMCKQHLMPKFGDTISNHFVSSFIASLGSAVASTPIDVVRTRLMNQKKLRGSIENPAGPRIYRGTLDCFLQTVKTEGPLALYKGFIPTWVRMGPWNILIMTFIFLLMSEPQNINLSHQTLFLAQANMVYYHAPDMFFSSFSVSSQRPVDVNQHITSCFIFYHNHESRTIINEN